MLSVLAFARKSLVRFVFGAAFLSLAGCATGPIQPGTGPASGGGGSVTVALLVPGGSGQASDELAARSLQNAARLAIADLNGVTVNLKVYNTAGQPGQAQAMALQAADEGAQIILGPLYAQEANAAGVAVAGRGLNVLSFSNNPDIAGGNTFVLGPTFENTARRLAGYSTRTGKSRIMIVHDRNTVGELSKTAIERGVRATGGSVVAISGYEFSQNGIMAAAPGIVAAARSSSAQAVFLTADYQGALQLISQLLRENGLNRDTTPFLGLTRWDIPAAALSLPGLQGGYFALPDPDRYAQYQARYQAAYGEVPPAFSGLAYDGIAAIGALARRGQSGPIAASALTQGAGFVGVNGIFRLRGDGTNERGLAVAQVRNNQVVVVDPAPRSFGGAGF